MKLHTTLRELRRYGICPIRHKHLKDSLGENHKDKTHIPLYLICEINGLDEAFGHREHAQMLQGP